MLLFVLFYCFETLLFFIKRLKCILVQCQCLEKRYIYIKREKKLEKVKFDVTLMCYVQ